MPAPGAPGMPAARNPYMHFTLPGASQSSQICMPHELTPLARRALLINAVQKRVLPSRLAQQPYKSLPNAYPCRIAFAAGQIRSLEHNMVKTAARWCDARMPPSASSSMARALIYTITVTTFTFSFVSVISVFKDCSSTLGHGERIRLCACP